MDMKHNYLTLVVRLLVDLSGECLWSHCALVDAILSPQQPILQSELSDREGYYDVLPWDPGLVDGCSEPLLEYQ
jgi:hypothetical protein